MTLEQAKRVAYELRVIGYKSKVHEDYFGKDTQWKTSVAIFTNAPFVEVGFLMCEAEIELDDLPKHADAVEHGNVFY